MTATPTEGQAVARATTQRSPFSKVWPAVLGLLVAIGSAYGMSDGREAATVLTASGFVYLAAAVFGRRGAAWPAFWVTFVLIGLGSVLDLDPVPWMLSIAIVLLAAALVRGATRPAWAVPLQAGAMLVVGTLALLAVRVDPVLGGLLVAAGLLAHAAWDVHHHRTGRVVSLSLAEFCAVLDVALAAVVIVVTVTA